MTGILNIKIIGTAPLTARLNNTVTKEKIEHALDIGAMWIERDAKELVRVKTGRLKGSIGINKPKPLVRMIGSGVEYAAAQEFGRPDLGQYGYTPYLRPAGRKNRKKIEGLLKQSFKGK